MSEIATAYVYGGTVGAFIGIVVGAVGMVITCATLKVCEERPAPADTEPDWEHTHG